MTSIDFDKTKFLVLLLAVRISRLRRQRNATVPSFVKELCEKHRRAAGGVGVGGGGGVGQKELIFTNCCAEEDMRPFSQITDLRFG